MAMPDSRQYPWNLYLIKDVEDIFSALDLKVFKSDISGMSFYSRYAQATFVKKPQLKIISFFKL